MLIPDIHICMELEINYRTFDPGNACAIVNVSVKCNFVLFTFENERLAIGINSMNEDKRFIMKMPYYNSQLFSEIKKLLLMLQMTRRNNFV